MPQCRRAVRPFLLLSLLAAFLGIFGLSAPATAQITIPSVVLDTNQQDLLTLGPGTTPRTWQFAVDELTMVTVRFYSGLGDLGTQIVGPLGQTITPLTAILNGGVYTRTRFPSGGPDTLIREYIPAGDVWEYRYTFLAAWPGMHTLTVTPGSSLGGAVPASVTVSQLSPLVSGMRTEHPTLVTGEYMSIGVVILQNGARVPGSSAVVSFSGPKEAPFAISLLDNGQGADNTANDGLYTGLFTLAPAGRYMIKTRASGVTPQGRVFIRSSVDFLQVIDPGAKFVNANITQQQLDDNADGLKDRVLFTANVRADDVGTHQMVLNLSTPSGRTVQAIGTATLQVGTSTMQAAIDAMTLARIAESGTYTITSAELALLIPAQEALRADVLPTLSIAVPIALNTFDWPPIDTSGFVSEQREDTDSDGLTNRLTLRVGVRVKSTGSYEFIARMVDSCSGEVQVISGRQTIVAGRDAGQNLLLAFNGSSIGGRGIAGVYKIQSLLISGVNQHFARHDVALTANIVPTMFEDSAPFQDANRNGEPDACDISGRLSTDWNGNGVPDEADDNLDLLCIADFNADGRVDADDLGQAITCFFQPPPRCEQADFNGNGVIDADDIAEYITAFFDPGGPCNR